MFNVTLPNEAAAPKVGNSLSISGKFLGNANETKHSRAMLSVSHSSQKQHYWSESANHCILHTMDGSQYNNQYKGTHQATCAYCSHAFYQVTGGVC